MATIFKVFTDSCHDSDHPASLPFCDSRHQPISSVMGRNSSSRDKRDHANLSYSSTQRRGTASERLPSLVEVTRPLFTERYKTHSKFRQFRRFVGLILPTITSPIIPASFIMILRVQIGIRSTHPWLHRLRIVGLHIPIIAMCHHHLRSA